MAEAHDEDRLRKANSALASKKTDAAALHIKAVALIKLDRLHEALELFDTHETLKNDAGVEYAYALYKCNRYEEAMAYLGKQKSTSRGMKHVQAQTAYRMEDFETAKSLYYILSREDSSPAPGGERQDFSINMKAVDVQVDWTSDRMSVPAAVLAGNKIDGFEDAFNLGCRFMAIGDLTKAELLLQKAAQLCKTAGLTEEESREEMCYILSQQIYLALRRRDVEKAIQLSTSLDPSVLQNPASERIGAINSVVRSANGNTNPYLLQRIYSNQGGVPEDVHLSTYQKDSLQRIKLAFALSTRKYNGLCRGNHYTNKPNTGPFASATRAAADCHCRDDAYARRRLLKHLRQHPDDIGALLLLLQLHIRNRKRKAAIGKLSDFFRYVRSSPDTASKVTPYMPGLVSIWVALVSSQGCTYRENGCLKKASPLLLSVPKATLCPSLARIAASALLTSSSPGDVERARELLAPLGKKRYAEQDSVVQAGLVAADARLAALSSSESASGKDSKVSEIKSGITAAEQIIQKVDAAALERQGGQFISQSKEMAMNRTNAPKPAPRVSTDTPDVDNQRTRASKKKPKTKQVAKRRPRKRHLRKEDANAEKDASAQQTAGKTTATGTQPDPERWLPLRDRSSYRPKTKKGKGKGGKKVDAVGATQGGVVVEGAGERNAEERGGNVQQGGSGGPGRGGGGGKKGGKGGRR